MTIGIGVISSYERPNDSLILVSDKLGSFGDDFATRRHAKMFVQPKDQLFAVCADSVDSACELIPKIAEQWMQAPERTFGHIRGGILEAVVQYKLYRFTMEVLPRYPFPTAKVDWREAARDLGIVDKLMNDWQELGIGCDLVIGSFDAEGVAHMNIVGSTGDVQPVSSSGFYAIGSGAFNALFWLAYREQSTGMSLLRSAYHVYEAKLMAEQSPHVGRRDIEMLIAVGDRYWHLTEQQPAVEGCPISLSQLKQLLDRFGPSSTESLGGR